MSTCFLGVSLRDKHELNQINLELTRRFFFRVMLASSEQTRLIYIVWVFN